LRRFFHVKNWVRRVRMTPDQAGLTSWVKS
jgi:hypothetical protein